MECRDIINTLAACLQVSGTDPGLAQFIQILLGVLIVTMAPLIVVILLIWVERKFAARVQDRIGPNRVGPYGLFQTVADALKLITKEDITPAGADRLIYNLAPIVSIVSVILIWAVIPFSPIHIGVDLSIGALYFVAVGSIGTLAIMMAGWSSNNKYALLGAFRVVAQLVSYEVPMVFALLVPVLIAGSMSMQGIVEAQRGMWFVVLSPVAALIFFISTQAETGRAPFDLIEAESELVAGFNIEYSGMKFGLFFAGEFVHVFTNALLMAALFFGGWVGPGVDQIPALGFVYIALKATVFYLVSLLLRSTLPRVRIDQLMSFNWKFLVPVSIVNVIVVAFLLQVVRALGLAPAADLANDFIANLPQAIVLLLGSLVIVAFVLQQLRNFGRQERAAAQTVMVRKEDDVDMLPAQAAH
ncbi:MAG: NADH-quinone oxidoreductase subunit NuoH [Anaerolineae bacterium]|nr:NADH-quinone oxidoreductase subunit NuoH [Anaerolineae bacterium]